MILSFSQADDSRIRLSSINSVGRIQMLSSLSSVFSSSVFSSSNRDGGAGTGGSSQRGTSSVSSAVGGNCLFGSLTTDGTFGIGNFFTGGDIPADTTDNFPAWATDDFSAGGDFVDDGAATNGTATDGAGVFRVFPADATDNFPTDGTAADGAGVFRVFSADTTENFPAGATDDFSAGDDFIDDVAEGFPTDGTATGVGVFRVFPADAGGFSARGFRGFDFPTEGMQGGFATYI